MDMSQKTIGDYLILKLLGQGALGTLYLAEHKYIKKTYALKVLPEELSSDRQFIQRFEKQMQLFSMLDHPHIVKIHNAGYEEGSYFFVTDCIVDEMGESTNLAQYLSHLDQPLAEERVWDILSQLAETLSWAHSRQIDDQPIVHKGLKLNNILIGSDRGNCKVYLSDFALSRIVGHGPLLSRTYKAVADIMGVHAGIYFAKGGLEKYATSQMDTLKISKLHQSFLQTYAFLAPEQKWCLDGKTDDIRTDIYAFGVLAYFLLMAEFPEGIFDLPSSRRKDLTKNWDSLVFACLQNDPLKRPATLDLAMHLLEEGNFSARGQVVKEPEGQLHFEGFDASSKALKPVINPQGILKPEYEPNPGAVFQIETSIAKYSPKAPEVHVIEPLLTEMMVIPGGHYYRGSLKGGRDEMPRHLIQISAFALDIHPVTNEQFVRFLEVMGGEKDANNNDIIRLRESRIRRSAGKLCIESGYAKHPVVGVTWYGAVAYAKWVGKRLPTEAEWEIAAAGGLEEALYPTGSNIERSQANFFSSDTTSVMSYPPNGYNLYDMPGNVYEWCQDWYGYNYYETSVQEPEDPKGPLQGVYRVLRGGCWKSLKEDLRTSHRHRNNPGTMNGTYGFRLAADVS